MVPPGQSADLRAYYNKHAKTDRLDSQVLARLPLLHPEGLHLKGTLGPGEPLKRAVKLRSGLVHRVTASMSRLAASKSYEGQFAAAVNAYLLPDKIQKAFGPYKGARLDFERLRASPHELAPRELEHLVVVRQKVSAPTSGPVQTDDLADCLIGMTYTLTHQHFDVFNDLSRLRPRTSVPGGFPVPARRPSIPSTSNSRTSAPPPQPAADPPITTPHAASGGPDSPFRT